jgi:uncharacterized lipoprotein YmbA
MVFLVGILFVSCSMPQTKIYSLSVPAGKKATDAKKQVLITLRVQAPRYLAQPYIAHRLSQYQLEISRYAKWDAPPSEMVKETFRDSLSATFQEVRTSNLPLDGSVMLTIYLKKFERVDVKSGELLFDAVLSSSEGRELQRVTAQKNIQLDSADDLGLAKGLSAALSEAVWEVIKGLENKI